MAKVGQLYLLTIKNSDNPPGGHLYFKLDIILVKGLSKHTLNTYSSGIKMDPNYAFLHGFS